MARQLLVAGDPTQDDFVVYLPPKRKVEKDWERFARFRFISRRGGVHLTEKTLHSLAKKNGLEVTAHAEKRDDRQTLHSLVELKADIEKRATPDNIPERYKANAARFRGYALQPEPGLTRATAPASQHSAYQVSDVRPFDIVTLVDAGNVLRHSPSFTETLERWVPGDGKLLVHKLHNEWQPDTPLHNLLASSAWTKQVPSAMRILHIGTDDLRRQGIVLRSNLNWSAALADIKAAVDAGSCLDTYLKYYGQVIVQFGLEGAAILSRSSGRSAVRCKLVYDSSQAEGDTERTRPGGLVYGQMNAFLCALLSSICDRQLPQAPLKIGKVDVARALSAARTYAQAEFTVSAEDDGDQLSFPPLKVPVETEVDDLIIPKKKTQLNSAGLRKFGIPDAEKKQEEWARKIVLHGGSTIKALPHAAYSDLITVDPDEIAAYRELRRLVVNYLAAPRRNKPMSISVFGAPGSGKSFGVTELTKDLPVKKYEFNLSEIDVDDLPGFFHELRDIEPDGKVPLCFFDEFDRNECELVARFLAPMQDGKFRDKGRTHPIGPAIFVFAGGTAETLKDFRNGVSLTVADQDKKGKKRKALVKSLKLPDFVSRLEGKLEIKGPNKPAIASSSDDNSAWRLRRAVLFRSVLERFTGASVINGQGTALIDEKLLDAFLFDAEYLSGARSLEKLVMMSALHGPARGFTVSDLPSHDLLAVHLKDANSFVKVSAEGRKKQ